MFELEIVPRVSETDGAGHVNNCVIPIWFEAGRRPIFRYLTPNLLFRDWKAALVNMNVDYVKQTYFQDKVVVRTWIKKIGNKSFQVYEEILQNNELCARGTATYVYFDYQEQKSKIIPAHIQSQLEKHLRQK